MLQKIAYIVGFVMVALGVLGFVPSASPGGLLLGLFQVDTLHNIVHLVTGLLALTAASSIVPEFTTRRFFQIFGVIYGIVALLGLFQPGPVLGMMANNTADTVLHIVIALVSLYLGFVYKETILLPRE